MLLAHPGGNLGDRMHTWQDIVSLYFLFFKMPNLITLNLEYEDSNRNQINETVHKKILCPETRVEAFRPAAFLLVPSMWTNLDRAASRKEIIATSNYILGISSFH